MRVRTILSIILVSTASLLACSARSNVDVPAVVDEAITSDVAKILDFKFQAEVVASNNDQARKAIVSQLMYVQGILTSARNGNGQIGNVKLSDVRETREGADKKRIKYQASLPIAWPKDVSPPSSYELKLPLDTTSLEAFNSKYDGRCGKSSIDQKTFWHDWNPKASDCSIDEGDVSESNAAVTRDDRETTNKYPEYDLIWADDRLDVVALFGIIAERSPADWGFTGARTFIENSTRQLSGAHVKENDASSSILQDTTVTGKTTVNGRALDVKVDVLVVPKELESTGGDFEARYDELSANADLILYNGHAGLGKNVDELSHKGKVTAGKYQLFLLNGCQTFAYLDTTLTDRRRAANGGNDPNGTKFLDIVGNALPGYANNLARVSNDIYDAVVHADMPMNYNKLLSEMPPSHVVVVFGEEDNRFTP